MSEANEAKWYVVHTYSGYENKVKVDIEKTIENRNLQDQILEVSIPLESVVEEKNGAKKQVSKKQVTDVVIYVTMAILGVLNIILLVTGFPRLFTIVLCLLFVPFFVRAMVYSFKFALGKIDYSISGTITEEEYEKIKGE